MHGFVMIILSLFTVRQEQKGDHITSVRSLIAYRHGLGLIYRRRPGLVKRSLGRMRYVGDKSLLVVSDGRKIWMRHGLLSSQTLLMVIS